MPAQSWFCFQLRLETQRARTREMTTIRRFCCNDLLRFASVNLDHLTETVRSFLFSRFLFIFLNFSASLWGIIGSLYVQFNMSFYMTYLARWPDYFHVAEGPRSRVMGYSELFPLILFHLIFFFFILLIFSHYFSVSWKFYWLVINTLLSEISFLL